MALIGEPNRSSIRAINSTDDLLGSHFSPEDLVFANVDFEFPEHVRYPVLPVRTENGLLFPRKGNSATRISEILLAKQLGCKISLAQGRQEASRLLRG